MVKTKISKRPRAYSKNMKTKKRGLKMELVEYDPTQALLDEERIGRAIWECLKNDDPEGVIEMIQIHLDALNKTKVAQEANLSKTTLYHALRNKNPTIKTLAKMVHASV